MSPLEGTPGVSAERVLVCDLDERCSLCNFPGSVWALAQLALSAACALERPAAGRR